MISIVSTYFRTRHWHPNYNLRNALDQNTTIARISSDNLRRNTSDIRVMHECCTTDLDLWIILIYTMIPKTMGLSLRGPCFVQNSPRDFDWNIIHVCWDAGFLLRFWDYEVCRASAGNHLTTDTTSPLWNTVWISSPDRNTEGSLIGLPLSRVSE